MQNFGRGMWRRISDYEKQQPPTYIQPSTNIQTNRLLHYIQTQKQRAINAYSGIALNKENVVVKEEVTINDVTDNYVIVEAVISEAEIIITEEPLVSDLVVISEAEEVVISEESVVTSEEPVVTSEEPVISEELVISEEPVVTEEVVTNAPEVIVTAPISKSNAKKRRKK